MADTNNNRAGCDESGDSDRDKVSSNVGGDELKTDVGNGTAGSVIGSKNVRQTQTRNDSPDVVFNNYDNNDKALAAFQVLQAQINRLEDNMNVKINSLRDNMTMKFDLLSRDIVNERRGQGGTLVQVASLLVALLLAFGLIYFGSGLNALGYEMRMVRERQPAGVNFIQPGNHP